MAGARETEIAQAGVRRPLHDAHVHLDYMADGAAVAAQAAEEGFLLFSNTVTPDGYEAARDELGPFPNVRVGLGLHPWHIGPAETLDRPIERFACLVSETRFVGEVGLDFGKRHEAAADAQMRAFRAVAGACAAHGGKVISVHAVKSAKHVLDILEESGALDTCTCILHWYSGPSDELARAIALGCRFSVGPRMLATKRGREYAKAIPAAQMLFETDAPPAYGEAYTFAELKGELDAAASSIAAIKGPAALDLIEEAARALFLQ